MVAVAVGNLQASRYSPSSSMPRRGTRWWGSSSPGSRPYDYSNYTITSQHPATQDLDPDLHAAAGHDLEEIIIKEEEMNRRQHL
ncbi:uncharacterized protein LOC123451131 [Hordeum vulgare subsp. vulgare]|uniref:uncharacterized protein LOC123451131 n=1 Tax=Hordeum vulgare subsp. vulgare TaxID=112509 RepID=UPI001D1A4E63|nr:uncharacterized protein LOC123451131 [Hordeum vulgare subsp. vulgare]